MTNTPTSEVAQIKTPVVASTEHLAAADNLKKHWTGDPTVLDTALKKAGLEPVDDPRSKDEKTFDAGFPVPADKSEYRLNFTGRSVGDTTALIRLNAEFGEMFSAMRLPTAMGQGLLEEMLDSSARYSKLSGAEKSLYEREQEYLTAQLGKKIGDLETIRKYAAVALNKADRAVLTKLAKNGSLENASVIVRLALHGQRMLYRERLTLQRGAKK